jgi:hypothetical protein
MHNNNHPPLESPGQLAMIAVVLWLIGAVLHPLAFLVPLGLLLLVGAGVAYAMRPRQRSMFWRGREIDLRDHQSASERLYWSIFRR